MGAAPPRTTPESPSSVRRAELERLHGAARQCVRCAQPAASRNAVVFGTGDRDAALMLVGGPPEQNEDRQGLPLVGAAGRLLTELLAELGLERDDVYLTSIVKCRPPQNREPLAEELAHCRHWLDEQVGLVAPRVVCSLGNLATKALRGDPTGIRQLRGRAEVRTIGPRAVRLLPLLHPAAALYQRAILEQLRADLRQLPELLALPVPEQPVVAPEPAPGPDPELAGDAAGDDAGGPPDDGPPAQLELFG